MRYCLHPDQTTRLMSYIFHMQTKVVFPGTTFFSMTAVTFRLYKWKLVICVMMRQKKTNNSYQATQICYKTRTILVSSMIFSKSKCCRLYFSGLAHVSSLSASCWQSISNSCFFLFAQMGCSICVCPYHQICQLSFTGCQDRNQQHAYVRKVKKCQEQASVCTGSLIWQCNFQKTEAYGLTRGMQNQNDHAS